MSGDGGDEGTGWESRTATVNGVRLHYVAHGAGPLVLLLHGFPEFWYTWRHLIPELAPHFRVVAPDLRGYNRSEARGPYDVPTLARDVAGLVDALGGGRAHLVGHDWGGGLAWYCAGRWPGRVGRLAVLNCPHPTVLVDTWRRSPRQLLRSLYIPLSWLPALPERLLGAREYAPLLGTLRRSSTRGAYGAGELERYRAALERSGLAGPLGYYRALRRPPRLASPFVVPVPTLHIWGERDPALGPELLRGTARYVPDYRLRTVPWATHWVHRDAPALVAGWLLPFLRGDPVPGDPVPGDPVPGDPPAPPGQSRR